MNLNADDLQLLIDVIDSRIETTRAELQSSDDAPAHVKPHLEAMQNMLERLKQAQTQAQAEQTAEAWSDYAESRKLPNNPPPGNAWP